MRNEQHATEKDKLRIYLDTSIISALHDDRWPQRRGQTEDFWTRIRMYNVCASQVTAREVADTTDEAKRELLLGSLETVRIEELTDDMVDLAEQYIAIGVYIRRQEDDALHVAAATLLRQDVLLSWNFEHLVNMRRREMIARANDQLGLETPQILPPPEL